MENVRYGLLGLALAMTMPFLSATNAFRLERKRHQSFPQWCELCHLHTVNNKYVGPPYRRAKMYAGSNAYCPRVSHDEYADETDRPTDASPLHYAFS